MNAIEKTQLPGREASVDLEQVNAAVRRSTAKLANSNCELKQNIVERKSAMQALRKNEKHQARLLAESLELQKPLRRLTHQRLAAQENERKKISQALLNDVAQTLLGIHTRLIALKGDATLGGKTLQKQISSTRQLVAKSASTLHRVARGFGRAS